MPHLVTGALSVLNKSLSEETQESCNKGLPGDSGENESKVCKRQQEVSDFINRLKVEMRVGEGLEGKCVGDRSINKGGSHTLLTLGETCKLVFY